MPARLPAHCGGLQLAPVKNPTPFPEEPDPIGFTAGDINLYRYVANGPLSKVDPAGTLIQHVIVLAVANAALAYSVARYCGDDQYDSIVAGLGALILSPFIRVGTVLRTGGLLASGGAAVFFAGACDLKGPLGF